MAYRNIHSNHPQFEMHMPKIARVIQQARDIDALPADIAAMVDRGRELADAAPTKAPTIEYAEQLIAAGMNPDEAIDREDASRRAVEQHTKAQAAASAAASNLTASIPAAVAKNADAIVEGSIRDKVNALLAEVRPHVAKLAEFGPTDKVRKANFSSTPIDVLAEYQGFNANDIIRRATPEQLKAFQACIEAESQFATVVALWLRVLQHGEERGYQMNSTPQYTGGIAVWAHPEKVPFLTIRGQAKGTNELGPWPTPLNLLTVASQPEEAGFRLASLREISAAYVNEVDEEAEREAARYRANFMSRGPIGDPFVAVRSVLSDLG